jgi:TonB family protein
VSPVISRSSALLAALLCTAVAGPAVAQGNEAGTEAVTPPRPKNASRIRVPHGSALPAGGVLLELAISEEGKVTAATVVESQGAEGDALALERAPAFEFEPALRNGVPIAVKVRYRAEFESEPAPEPEPTPEPPPATTAAPAPSVPPVQTPSAAPLAADELEAFEGTTTVNAPAREVTRRSVDRETLERVPGTGGDTLRGVELMPGVARTSQGFGDPILRGASFNESQTFLNGTPVPFLFHFGGLKSFINSRMVDRLDLYPGNFAPRYGRVSGGVIEVRTRDPEGDDFHGAVDLNLIDSSVYADAPIGDKVNVAAAVRRSNIDFFFENFVPEDAYSVVAAPTYYDYQLLTVYRIDAATRLRLLGYGSRDSIELFFRDPPDDDPAIAGRVEGSLEFHRLGLELETGRGKKSSTNVSVTGGLIEADQHFGELRQRFTGFELHGRAETRHELHETLNFTLGGDFFGSFLDGTYHGPRPGQLEGDPRNNDPLASRSTITIGGEDRIDTVRPAAYLELGFRPLPNLLLAPGARLDYFGDLRHLSVDPRFAARYEFPQGTVLKGGVGYYTQQLEFWQSLPVVGNPEIDPWRALHTSAGVEQHFGDDAEVGVEGFYKHLEDVVIGTPSREAPYFVNEGSGRIYGAEFSGRARLDDGFAELAYTISRSERREFENPYRLFDQDQTHILVLAAEHGLGGGFRLGARYRLVSGNPTTPVEGSVYDATTGIYVPRYGATNSERAPLFHQLDVRFEKEWQVGPVELAAYIDVQNAYNAENPQGYRYSYDYSEKEAVTGLPIFPNLGLRGEL